MAEETNEDWIKEIVERHYEGNGYARIHNPALISELAAEVTSRLAEAYEEGRNDAEIDAQIENKIATAREEGYWQGHDAALDGVREAEETAE